MPSGPAMRPFFMRNNALSTSSTVMAAFGSYTSNLARLESQWQAHWARNQVQAHKSRKEK
jgi:hypothetical protein